jgi:hemerythrin
MLAWSHNYAIGIEKIDLEHRTFLNLVNEFNGARLAGASQDKLLRMLREISLYARFHFFSEENVMEDIGYPELDAHRNCHYVLIEVLSNKLLGLQMGDLTAAAVEAFLLDWFVDHVTHIDSKIAEFLQRTTGLE